MLHTANQSEILSASDSRRLCDGFSAFFTNKVNNIKSTISSVMANRKVDPHACDVRYAGECFRDVQSVSTTEVLKILQIIPGKSSPLDIIPTSLLKMCSDDFAPLIAHLASLSFAEGRFPASFKHASVKPLLKQDGLNRDEFSNYRPISNLSTISKILERLFLVRLLPHVSCSPNFSRVQSAYRRFYSTETALVRLLNDVFLAAGAGKATVLASLDISAAFDTIETCTLISRLEFSFGITGNAIAWLKSYLTDRTQSVKVGTSVSSTTQCRCGVPQGSVLGPILFLLYTITGGTTDPQFRR